ncbi:MULTISPECIES: helix-turn-helix domain-containing protein [Rhodococcus]|uniref:helix-turn-helix domain-containing protein n=1 Tax=Rhodococcus TaxID=1827 RepID=UPI000C7D0630|nr:MULTISPECIES: helix-turn-helix domain-containing protein [Rhodococcus]AUM18238.1 hypothetical protein CSW53_17920 [Rhodococcus ruber]
MPPNRTGPKAINHAELVAQALRHRRRSKTYAQIAEALGISRSYAHDLVKEGLGEIIREPAEQVLDFELDKLDILEQKLTHQLEADPDKAVNAYVKVMQHRARLLGLYPTDNKTELTVPDALEWIRAMRTGKTAGAPDGAST